MRSHIRKLERSETQSLEDFKVPKDFKTQAQVSFEAVNEFASEVKANYKTKQKVLELEAKQENLRLEKELIGQTVKNDSDQDKFAKFAKELDALKMSYPTHDKDGKEYSLKEKVRLMKQKLKNHKKRSVKAIKKRLNQL